MLTIVIIVTAFVGVAALVGGVALLLRGNDHSATEDRLDILAGKKEVSSKPDEPSLLARPLDDASVIADFISRYANIRGFLEQSGSQVTPAKLVFISLGFAGVSAALCLASPLHAAIAPVVGLCCGFLPLGYFSHKRKRRLAKFGRQLPDALELVSRALRAGHSLGSGMNLVATEMDQPIANEFMRCYEEQNLGIPLEDALEEMSERVPNLDLRFFVTAVTLQRQTGGDLAEILDKIGKLIRERFRIWGQIQALTGEGRLSGIVLLALPPVLFMTMYRLNPDYCKVLFDDPMGQQLLAGAVVMQVLGALVIKKIINIKV